MLLGKRRIIFFLVGDIFFLYLALALVLAVRYYPALGAGVLKEHLFSFSILIFVWVLVFFIAGLYDRGVVLFKRKLVSTIFHIQIVNVAVAVFFFYLIPFFNITPKTNLFLYLIFSSLLIAGWRVMGARILESRRIPVVMFGASRAFHELVAALRDGSAMRPMAVIDTKAKNEGEIVSALRTAMSRHHASAVILEMNSSKSRMLFAEATNLLFNKVQFIDVSLAYEEVFGRAPLSLIDDKWVIQNVSPTAHFAYDVLKRGMDIFISLFVLVISLALYPFAAAAIKLDDGGSVFIYQKRVGKKNELITLLKFRTMAFDDRGNWETEGKQNKLTRVGPFLRTSRIDELPQLWNVLKGDISLIGPRPEFPQPVGHYNKEIPYYNVRHLIKPGLSGWAQINHHEHPHHAVEVSETKKKLSYDLYYIKNRSFALDLEIVLKTMRILLQRKGA